MSIYQKNLRRMGFLLIAASIADLILELSLYKVLQAETVKYNRQMLSHLGICLKDGIGLLTGLMACYLYYQKKYSNWIIRIIAVLLCAEIVNILVTAKGNLSNRVDYLINVILILTAMVLYTAMQLQRGDHNWQKICGSKPIMLDLKLTDVRQWFNPIEIGPKLELSQEISSVVDRFLSTQKEQRPLAITVRCPNAVSESMQGTMQEVFQMYYEDEERHINDYLERRYMRVMALVIISIMAVSVWIYFAPTNSEGVTWTILSNFAAFSLWQIGSTYYERSEGYGELLRAQIATQAKLHFWAG